MSSWEMRTFAAARCGLPLRIDLPAGLGAMRSKSDAWMLRKSAPGNSVFTDLWLSAARTTLSNTQKPPKQETCSADLSFLRAVWQPFQVAGDQRIFLVSESACSMSV